MRTARRLCSLVAAAALLPLGLGVAAGTASAGTAGGARVGHWQVTALGGGTYRATWTSPRALPMTDARPEILLDGTPLATQAGVRRVTAIVSAGAAPAVSQLDVSLSGRLIDRAATRQQEPAATPYTTPATTQPTFPDPGRKGPHKIVSSDYTLNPAKVVGMPEKVEMVGHIVRPKDADSSDPLVLFLHGRHNACYTPSDHPSQRQSPAVQAAEAALTTPATQPGKMSVWQCPTGQEPIPSYLGYDYAQRLLASQGYVTVSISADAINALDYNDPDGGAASRADLIRKHLMKWVSWVKDGKYKANLDDVILIGHSRGGEGVARASIITPLSAPYHIAGQVLIAPTDFSHQAPAYIPTILVMGYCDGDVSDLQGQIFSDVSRDLATDDTSLHSSVLIMGADHNFFNTQWTPGESEAPSWDDWSGPADAACGTDDPTRLTAQEQQRVAKTYFAGAVQLMASGRDSLLPMFDGTAVHLKSAGPKADVRTELIGAGRDLRRPGIDADLGNSSGGATTQLCIGIDGGDQTDCGYGASGSQTPHWLASGLEPKSEFEMSWTQKGATGGLTFPQPMDLSGDTSLDLRTAVDPTIGDVKLAVTLHDASGSTTVTPLNNGVVPALEVGSPPLSKRWAQTLRVPLDKVKGVDLSAITGIDLVARNGSGRVFVLDVAGVAPGLPTPPDERLGVADMVSQTIKVKKGATSIKVPFTISGDVQTGAHLLVYPSGPGISGMITVKLKPGQQQGTIKVPVSGGVQAGFTLEVDAYATVGVMTGNYIGRDFIQVK